MKEVKDYLATNKRFWSSLHQMNDKFLVIPVVFIFLRVWTGIVNILYLYARLDTAALSEELNLALLYLSVSDHNNHTKCYVPMSCNACLHGGTCTCHVH